MKRVRNYGFWTSLFALIPFAYQVFGGELALPDNYVPITNAILALLLAAGVCNNPTTENKGFLDDNQ